MLAIPVQIADVTRRAVRRHWGDALLLVAGLQALVWMARPEELVHFVGPQVLDGSRAFDVAVVLALGLFAVLSLRFLTRLMSAARRVSWDPALRGEQGTVMAEFALVLPIVLMMLGTVMQIALIANAALVVRYAAFAAARSAIVSFEAEMPGAGEIADPSSLLSTLQAPPFPEWVDRTRPEHAAALVLASISPTMPGIGSPESGAMRELLLANAPSWDGGGYNDRVTYARAAMTLRTIADKYNDDDGSGSFGGDMEAWHDSVPPLIPMPEHAVQPQRLRDATPEERENLGYLVPSPPDLADLIPNEINIEIDIPLPSNIQLVMDTVGIDNPSIPFPPIPLGPVKSAAGPLLDQLDAGVDVLRSGAASGIRTYARSGLNVDFIGPKEVEISLTYAFKLNLPSILQLVPDGFGLTEPAPGGLGRAFRIQQRDRRVNVAGSSVSDAGDYTVRLQSTGGRRTLLGIVPKVPDVYKAVTEFEFETVNNTPLYFVPRGETKADKAAAEKKKKAEEEKKKKAKADKKKKAEEAKKKKEADKKKAAAAASGSSGSGTGGTSGGGS